jgi:hypothetical protein
VKGEGKKMKKMSQARFGGRFGEKTCVCWVCVWALIV